MALTEVGRSRSVRVYEVGWTGQGCARSLPGAGPLDGTSGRLGTTSLAGRTSLGIFGARHLPRWAAAGPALRLGSAKVSYS